MSEPKRPALLRLRLRPAAERAVRAGHPWVFTDSVRERNRPGATGDVAAIYDQRDRLLALGLFDAESPIAVRMLHVGERLAMTPDWWRERLRVTVARRAGIAGPETNGFRLINGESDGWPALVLDRYADTLVLKLYSAIWLPRLWELREWIRAEVPADRLVLRLSRNLQPSAESAHQVTDGALLFGDAPTGPVVFTENGLRFEADVLRGQKTGFFLDQRENRRRVGELSAGRHMLNCFSFSGAFSLYAARGGAAAVTDLDISRHALASARRNFALNAAVPELACCPRESVQANAFDFLGERLAPRYDLIVLDPPSLAKREADREGALRAYHQLAAAAVGHLRRGGILVAASCSAHVRADEFFTTTLAAVRPTGRPFRELERTGHAPDHPAAFPEAAYLKCVYLRFEPA